jgi:hypothetical protein
MSFMSLQLKLKRQRKVGIKGKYDGYKQSYVVSFIVCRFRYFQDRGILTLQGKAYQVQWPVL